MEAAGLYFCSTSPTSGGSGAEPTLGSIRTSGDLLHGVVIIPEAGSRVERAFTPEGEHPPLFVIVSDASEDAFGIFFGVISHDAPVWEPRVRKGASRQAVRLTTDREDLRSHARNTHSNAVL